MGMMSEIMDSHQRKVMTHFGGVINKGGGQAFPCEATYKKEKVYIGGLTRKEYFAEGIASSLASKLIEQCFDEDGELNEYKWERLSDEITKASYILAEKMSDEGNNQD
jgi:hypothetical protein